MRLGMACLLASALLVSGCGGSGSITTVATPTFTPASGATLTIGTNNTVTIADATTGATIHYTTDGSTPTASSTTYSGAITLSTAGSATINAIATMAGDASSAVATATYTVSAEPAVATPTFTPATGATLTIGTNNTVTIADATTGAAIVYTTDGSNPLTSSTAKPYTGVITLLTAGSVTFNAAATMTGDTSSAVATATYTVAAEPVVATPTVTPATGATLTIGTNNTVAIADATAGAAIVYTTDGSNPFTSSTAKTYSGAITLSTAGSVTINAAAIETGYTSATATATYNVVAAVAATPTFTPATGATLTIGTNNTVTIADATTGAAIVYTTDGSNPLTSSTAKTYSGAITLSTAGSVTVSAAATATGYTSSAVATATYTVETQAATPTFTPATGATLTIGTNNTVTIADATTGAAIVYTTDGSNPLTSSTAKTYSGAITLSTAGSVTVSAAATATSYASSAVATATYTVVASPDAVTVDFTDNLQTIRGFGGSTAWLGKMPAAVATALFNQTTGLGLSILRVRIDPEGSSTGGGNFGYPYETGEWDYEAINGQLAVQNNPNAIVFATPWTPPATWKLSGTTIQVGNNSYNEAFASSCSPKAGYCGGYLDPNHYADYSNYLEDFVTFFNSQNSFDLYAISMQNEPEENVTYESCIWTPAQMDSWIDTLVTPGPNPLTAKLMMPEADSFQPVQALTALQDTAAEGLISIIGGHLYGVSPTPYTIPAGDTPKEVWMTEYGPLSTASLTWAQALTYAQSIHQSMVIAQYNAYVWWGVFGEGTGSCATGAGTCGLVDDSGNVMPIGYVMGQYSKFIQPGYTGEGVTPSASEPSNVLISAYTGSEGGTQHYVIVAINMGTTAVSQSFTLQNGAITSMTPYQTTSTATTGTGLVPQSAVTVTNNAFSYTLPAQSITTFVQ